MTTSRNDAHIRKKGGWRMAAAAAAAAAFAFALLCFPGIAGAGVTQGLSSCVNTLIPSLFPFMVLSTYMAESGLAASLGKWAQPVTRFLFRQPGCAAAVVLMGFVGGYPAGAKTVSRLLEQGELTREQAGRLLCFCVSAGPPFVLTAVGIVFGLMIVGGAGGVLQGILAAGLAVLVNQGYKQIVTAVSDKSE